MGETKFDEEPIGMGNLFAPKGSGQKFLTGGKGNAMNFRPRNNQKKEGEITGLKMGTPKIPISGKQKQEPFSAIN